MLSQLRRSRYGYLLALHVLLLCAAGRTPTEIAFFLFCSRSSIYRIVTAYRCQSLGFVFTEDGRLQPSVRTSCLSPSLRRSLLALLKVAPHAFGWCRTRWTCATLAAQLKINRGITVSADTLRRWLGEIGWVWKRAKLAAKDDDPQRIEKLARIRWIFEHISPKQLLLFADELDIHLLAKVGYQWMEKGTQLEVMTPGTNEKNYLAGAIDIATGHLLHCVWFRKTSGLFIDLLQVIDRTYSARDYARIFVVVDNYKIHKAKLVELWLAAHPHFELVYLPTYCPKADPIERAFGDVHDKCTRNHKRKRLRDLVGDVVEHFCINGPWQYKLSEIYYEPEVTAAVEKMDAEKRLKAAA
ncbi:MAG: IS630 family transposase [Blastocatellia bacterium]